MALILKNISFNLKNSLFLVNRFPNCMPYGSCTPVVKTNPPAVPTTSQPASTDGPSPPSDAKFERIVRQEPGKVELGFIPKNWITAFHNKTGVTGFYTFCITFGIYLISKEKYVMEHEYYGGLSFGLLWYLAVTNIGQMVGKSIDKEVDEYETAWNEGRVNEKLMLEDSIKDEETLQWSSAGQVMLADAKRENVGLQLEACYRENLMRAYKETKRRLDYQVELQNIDRRILHKNMVFWVHTNVLASITPEQETEHIDQCIDELAVIAARTSA